MPNCFTLTRKSDPQAGPVNLTVIDEEMCAHFKVDCDEEHWYCMWHDIIGLGLACGRTFSEIRERFRQHEGPYTDEQREVDARLIEIVNWLEEHFTSNAWYQHK